MKTAKEILYATATKYNDGFMSGQVKWILEAMEEYKNQENVQEIFTEQFINDHLNSLKTNPCSQKKSNNSAS